MLFGAVLMVLSAYRIEFRELWCFAVLHALLVLDGQVVRKQALVRRDLRVSVLGRQACCELDCLSLLLCFACELLEDLF